MSALKGTSANRNSSYFDWTSTESTQTRLIQARRNFLSALDERFGKGPSASPAPQMDWRTVLVSLVSLQLVNVQLTGPNQARLELKTTSKGPRDRLVAEDYTFPAVKEQGYWKLDIVALTTGAARPAGMFADVYERITQQIRAGARPFLLAGLLLWFGYP
jgi:hypothetical protein